MATIIDSDVDFDYDAIDEAILLQAEDGISYSPDLVESPPLKPPVLLDPDAGLTSTSKTPPQAELTRTPPQAVMAELAAAHDEGGPGYGAEASGMARTTHCPPPQ